MTDPVAPRPPKVVETEVCLDLDGEAAPVVAVDIIVPRKPPVALDVAGNGTARLRVPIKFRLHFEEPRDG